jgi:peptidoglycan hydrolase-like protein with peptidoglycan-binding domain
MRRAIVLSAGSLVVAVAAVVVTSSGGGSTPAPAAATTGATAPVERHTLVDRQRADGALGYAGTRAVASRLAGTITWLPTSGARVRRGERLFEVDERPVILMSGRRPAHRALGPGAGGGEDVRQLERNLVALGFDPYGAITIDRSFDAATAAAVRRWRNALGLSAGSSVELGRVVFLPGTRRVTDIQASIGDAGGGGQGAATPVLKTTSTRQVVTLDLSAADATVAYVGQRVDVELPDSSHVRGRVARVGSVATAAAQDGGGSGDPTITVTITIARKGGGARLDRAPVSVQLTRTARRNVLAVPVTALLAQRGGGYAVQLAGRPATQLVAVTTGLFADGYVEVRSRALRAGQRVTVPAA